MFTTVKGSARAGIARELHKQARKNYQTRYVELKGINDLYQADLVDMSAFSKVNKGYKFILVVINCFTKYVITKPLKNKTAKEVEMALRPIFLKFPMKHFQTDKGTEFFNKLVKTLLDEHGINHYFTFSERKATIVERFNRTLKGKMWRLFSERGSYKWWDILPELVASYNNTYHRTIGMKPVEVTTLNESTVLRNIGKSRVKSKIRQKFFVGDKVRISRLQNTFTKGYLPRWSNEVYTVYEVKPTVPVSYLLQDDKGTVLKGCFYQEELSKTKYSDTFLIEKVVRRKGDKLLVRWLGFDKSHDCWINKSDLV